MRKALTYFSDLRACTLSEMYLVSLPFVSAKPGVSMNITSLFDPLQKSFLPDVSIVVGYILALVLNSF